MIDKGTALDSAIEANDMAAKMSLPTGRRRVLVLASTFPSRVQPIHGVFVKERVRAVSQLADIETRVISPVPYFPPIRAFPRWYPLSQIPQAEVIDGLEVTRPRYFLPPKIGGYFHPRLMDLGIRRAVDHMFKSFPFDLIDAHFAYPDGVVAAMLGQKYNRPVVITGRGEEIARFPRLPVIGPAIRWALKSATRLVAVTEEIGRMMEAEGADPSKITVIKNGVDTAKFQPMSRDEARTRLGLPLGRPLIVSAGYRLEIKGFHLLIDAIPRIREIYPEILVAIVGGQARWGLDYTAELERHIRENRVEDFVIMPGARPPHEMPWWYSSGDLFALLSSREGSSNVLMEALACGLPAVGTPVGGIAELLRDSRLGLILPERSAPAVAAGVISALQHPWNRPQIRAVMETMSWETTARKVRAVFLSALEEVDRNRNILHHNGVE